MAPGRPAELGEMVAMLDTGRSARPADAHRLAHPDPAAGAHDCSSPLAEEIRPSELIVSSFGIREGLLYPPLDQAHARARPADRGGARGGQGAEPLRRAWRPARPLDRADLRRPAGPWPGSGSPPACSPTSPGRPIPISAPSAGVEMALHGNWVGDRRGRAGDDGAGALFATSAAANPARIRRSRRSAAPSSSSARRCWGLAMRLGQRLSGGLAASLERSALSIEGRMLRLHPAKGARRRFTARRSTAA